MSKRQSCWRVVTLLLGVLLCHHARADDSVKITPDVVYGHKLGLAMTFDVYQPKSQANGAGVLFMVSGGWYSNWRPPEQMLNLYRPLLEKGFTVFSVRHGSSPRFTLPEAVADVRRSVRYIRTNAAEFGVAPDRLGVFGMSAGGHLSLLLGAASDEGDQKAKDEVERASDRVAAVVAFVAPTDLTIMVPEAKDRLPAYANFPALNLKLAEAKLYSPLFHVSPDDPPTLLIAGDKDTLVPIEHSKRIHEALRQHKVENELMVIEGAGHGIGGDDLKRSLDALVNWFDRWLVQPPPQEKP